MKSCYRKKYCKKQKGKKHKYRNIKYVINFIYKKKKKQQNKKLV